MLIPLHRGKGRRGAHGQLEVVDHALIDDADAELVGRFKVWYLTKNGYATANEKFNGGYRGVLMHRIICPTVNGMVVDHINRNRIDNRRSNLRACTYGQSQHNRSLKSGNIHKNYNWYHVNFMVDGVLHNFGKFRSIEEAIPVRDAARTKLHGEFALAT